ncbi:MAG: LysR family transcriptional regulator [Woeseiaceae bacterium]|nr:LysR family transcriptional regulator [Woeseiaceae bacterium]
MSKPLDRLTLLETFVRIADAGSISAAARDLGLSQPSASRQLAELESRLKTQLIRRTTHSLVLTDAGVDLLADARQMIDGWEALSEKHLASDRHIQGSLKVVAPVALGQLHLARIAWRFQQDHPGVRVSWRLEDDPIRFAEVGCDCWIKVGPVPDETLVVRSLGAVERLLVASRSFITQHGMPENPKAAERLPLAALEPFEGQQIPLVQGEKRTATIRPEPRMRTNNIFALKEAALMGLGMAVMPRWFVAPELKSGELIDILPTWRAPSLDVHVAYLPGRHQTLRLTTFLETLREQVLGISGIFSRD